ncbi:MAG: NUDIX hydrolase [Chloroflexi bacterium]|nr:NUDIX hydrolase [Chloroflexota bacterium]
MKGKAYVMTKKRFLLWVWREVPFPDGVRHLFLRILNPSFMIGAMALIQDEQGRILVLEHTYRKQRPWGLPGGWLKTAESPEQGLAREVYEETGYTVRVDALLAAEFLQRSVLDLMYQCTVLSGTFHATDETAQERWVAPADLPELLPNQAAMLYRVGVHRRGRTGPTTPA